MSRGWISASRRLADRTCRTLSLLTALAGKRCRPVRSKNSRISGVILAPPPPAVPLPPLLTMVTGKGPRMASISARCSALSCCGPRNLSEAENYYVKY